MIGPVDFVDDVVRRFTLVYREIPRRGLFRAAKAFARYRERQGAKASVLPDVFIGGHAEAEGLPLLTRDTKRLGSYFPTLTLICPPSGERSWPNFEGRRTTIVAK